MRVSIFLVLLGAVPLAVFIAVLVLGCRVLWKYLRTQDVRTQKAAVVKSLGQALKTHRTARGMTQEFVAEALGVSRQAVSKWEQGHSDPSTSNLLALAKLYGVSAQELLEDVQPGTPGA